MSQKQILKVILFLSFLSAAISEFNLTIIHITDFHSHWFEFDENEGKCSEEESKAGKCYGGFPRLVSFVRNIRDKEKNVLVLSSGEFYLGRSLNALHGWKLAQAMLPYLGLDAMSLSNHDFDSGMFELSAFLYAMKFPVLCANMWARNTSFIYSRVKKSVVLDVGGEKVGIVGYVHPDTLMRSKNAVSVKFSDEIPALIEEVKHLEEGGLDKIIALGHSGFYTDLEIANKVKGVDVVIGGSSDVVNYKPVDDDIEPSAVGNIHENYPRVHHQKDDDDAHLNNKTLILHIPQHGKYVGVVRLTFNDKGKIIYEEGSPVILDSSILQDNETLIFLHNASSALEKISEHSRLPNDNEILAVAKGNFEGRSRKCRMEECSLGNLVADAMLHEFVTNHLNETQPEVETEMWGPVDAVVFNSGSIRHSLEAGNIKIKDLLHSLFIGDFIQRVYMSGKKLKEMMEHSVRHYDPSGVTSPGCFLQVSGLKVEYDVSKKPGDRVRNLLVRCRNCNNSVNFSLVKPQKTYIIAMPSYMAVGGDGFRQFESVDPLDFGQFDALLIVQYLRKMREITPMLDGRIKFYIPADKASTTTKPDVQNSGTLVTPSPTTVSMKPKKRVNRVVVNTFEIPYSYVSVMKGEIDSLVSSYRKARDNIFTLNRTSKNVSFTTESDKYSKEGSSSQSKTEPISNASVNTEDNSSVQVNKDIKQNPSALNLRDDSSLSNNTSHLNIPPQVAPPLSNFSYQEIKPILDPAMKVLQNLFREILIKMLSSSNFSDIMNHTATANLTEIFTDSDLEKLSYNANGSKSIDDSRNVNNKEMNKTELQVKTVLTDTVWEEKTFIKIDLNSTIPDVNGTNSSQIVDKNITNNTFLVENSFLDVAIDPSSFFVNDSGMSFRIAGVQSANSTNILKSTEPVPVPTESSQTIPFPSNITENQSLNQIVNELVESTVDLLMEKLIKSFEVLLDVNSSLSVNDGLKRFRQMEHLRSPEKDNSNSKRGELPSEDVNKKSLTSVPVSEETNYPAKDSESTVDGKSKEFSAPSSLSKEALAVSEFINRDDYLTSHLPLKDDDQKGDDGVMGFRFLPWFM